MKKILIIDADQQAIETVLPRLQQSGFSVVAVSNTVDGLKSAVLEKPDLVLLDMVQPVGSGALFLERMTRHPSGLANTKVMLLRCNQAPEITAQAKKMGVKYCLNTPLQDQNLFATIHSVLQTAA
jgi:CheY-like chemotaxis protein